MKKYLTIIMILTAVALSYSQEQQGMEVDSILILNPDTGKIVYTLKDPKKDLDKTLDSLNVVHKSDEFYLYYYTNIGAVYKCRARKKRKQQDKMIKL